MNTSYNQSVNHRVFEQSPTDEAHYEVLRKTVSSLITRLGSQLDQQGLRILDIAPEAHAGAAAAFSKSIVHTLDIDENSGATYIADLCRCNCKAIPGGTYDVVICTEVLEHTRYPWKATKEIHRLLRPGGIVAFTTPFNFRIHGPAPDCWRFTAAGLEVLLEDFTEVKIEIIEDPERPRMPIQYVSTASKKQTDQSGCWD